MDKYFVSVLHYEFFVGVGKRIQAKPVNPVDKSTVQRIHPDTQEDIAKYK